MPRSIAFPNSLGTVVRMEKPDFIKRHVNRVSGFNAILPKARRDELEVEVRKAADETFERLYAAEQRGEPIYF